MNANCFEIHWMHRVSVLGVSLNIYEGQITALLGHSGSGKSTLLNVLGGFSKPSAGKMMDL